MNKEIKPCPFCGSDRVQTISCEIETTWLLCKDCRATGPMMPTSKDAIERWNAAPRRLIVKLKTKDFEKDV